MNERGRKLKMQPKGVALPPSATLFYHGSRRLPDLPDRRQVWQAYVEGQWRTYYEVPIDAADLGRIRQRPAKW